MSRERPTRKGFEFHCKVETYNNFVIFKEIKNGEFTGANIKAKSVINLEDIR